jgi:putative transposase
VKYRFIDAHRAAYPVERLCRVLAVSRSSYYAWRNRRPSARQQQDAVLGVQIRLHHTRSRATYGSRRLSHALRAQGVVCSRARVARLMRQQGLETRIRRAYRVTTRPNPRLPVAPNRLDRQFTATRPNEKWLADFTYIRTHQGWLYLATVLDVFSRQIVGWSMSHRPQTVLVENALRMGLARRCPSAGLLHHSDQGSQYASGDYQKLLAKHGIEVSMSRTGVNWLEFGGQTICPVDSRKQEPGNGQAQAVHGRVQARGAAAGGNQRQGDLGAGARLRAISRTAAPMAAALSGRRDERGRATEC